MKKIDKIKAALKNLLVEFRSINTDKAVLSWDGEDDIKEGTAVYVTDEEGNNSIPEDGEYIDENKVTYVVESGIIKEVIPAPEEEQPTEEPEEQPEAPTEEPAEEQPAEEPVEEPAEEEKPAEEPEEAPAEEPVETPVEVVEEVAEEANDLAERVDELIEKINRLEEEMATLKAFKATVEAMSAGKPAQQEFRETKVDTELFKNKDLQNLHKLFQ